MGLLTRTLPALLARRLAERYDEPQITVLRRSGPPSHLRGRDLQVAATAMQQQWLDWFGPGSLRLVLALPPGELFLSALIAGILAGHTLIPVAPPRRGALSDRLTHIVRDCAATAVLCTANLRDAVRASLTASQCPVMALDGSGDNGRPPADSFPRALSENGPAPVIIQYTSGSTRLPKGVRLFGAQILANCDLVARSWGMNSSTRFVNWLPHYHDMGLMGGILYPLLMGGYSAQMSPLDMVRRPADWLRAISEHRATFSGGPAFAFADCLRRVGPEECEGLDLSSWIRAFCGAEPIPAGLLPSFRRRFAPYGLKPESVFGCYGMAEMTLFAAGAPEPADLPLPPETCASVHPCRLTEPTRPNLRVVDPQTRRPLPDGETGEIWLRGTSMAEGYLNLPDETAEVFHVALAGETDEDWLRTGDLGVIDGDLLYVTGRSKDIVIAHGRKIAAAEVEWLAASLDDALNPLAAAAFMPDPAESAVAVLLIELKSGRDAPDRPTTVRTAIERAVAGEWGIRLQEVRILPRGQLARTSSGKVRRQAIAEAYRQRRMPPTDDGACAEEPR